VQAGGQYQLKPVNGAWLDYETEQTVNLTITATDPGGLSDQVDFIISVGDAPGANVIGTSSSDIIDATHTPKLQAYVGNEDDVIDGRAGNDTMAGGLGNDTYFVDSTGDKVIENPGQGVDAIRASVTYSLQANVKNLTLTGISAINGSGNALANSLVGNSANNTLAGLGGADALDGGDGIDTASYAASFAGVNISLQGGTATGGDAEGDTFVRIENLTGSQFGDTLEGNSGNNLLLGGNGSDTVSYAHATSGVSVTLASTAAQNTVGAGIDTLSAFENLMGSQHEDMLTGNNSANLLMGLGGNDVLVGGSGADTMVGGDGNDSYTVDNSGDFIDETGGSGIDIVNTSMTFSLADAVHVKGDVENPTLMGTSGINGTGNALDNAITGNGGANILARLGGADILDGGAGVDTVTYAASSAGVNVSLMTSAGSGGDVEGDTLINIEKLTGSAFDDTLEGDGAANVLNGGTGIDTVSYEHAVAGVTVNLATTGAQAGGAGSDTLSGFENLTGSQFDDILSGTSGANTIVGGAGNDKITGGGGSDILVGGAGTDTFIFKAAADSAPSLSDLIGDFLAGTDKIDLSVIDSNTAVSGNQAFLYGGENQNVVANSVTWFTDQASGNTIIQADLNGNSVADMQIVLTGINPNLHAADFVL
jgi:Ca2+-binding RTX toxin-like protein